MQVMQMEVYNYERCVWTHVSEHHVISSHELSSNVHVLLACNANVPGVGRAKCRRVAKVWGKGRGALRVLDCWTDPAVALGAPEEISCTEVRPTDIF